MSAKDCISRISELTGRLEVLKQAAEDASSPEADIDQGIEDVLNHLLELKEGFGGDATPSGDMGDRRQEVLTHRRVFSLLNVLPGIVFLVDKDYRIRFANHTFLDSFTDPREMCCFEVIHGRVAPCESCLLQDIFAERQPRSWQWNTQDGKHFRIFGYPFSDVDDSQLVLLLGVDLTEQTRAAEALARNEYWLRTIMDNSSDGINVCRWDTETDKRTLVMCNKRFVEMSGYGLEELMARDDLNELTTAGEDEPAEQSGVLRSRGISSWKRPDGKENHHEWTASRIEMDGQQYVVGVDRDITERLKAEQEFKEAKDRLENIIDFLPDAAYVVDSSKHVIAWNREMERMYGVKAEDIVGTGDYAYGLAILGRREATLIDLITDDNEELRSRYDYVDERGQGLVAEQYNPRAYDGRGAFLWMTAAPLCDSEGNVVGAIECIRDVTDYRKAKEQLEAGEAAERAFRHQLEVLHQVNLELTSAESIQELCRRAVELSCEKLEFDRMGIWFKVNDDPLRFRGSFGVDEQGNLRDESECELEGTDRATDLMSGKTSIWSSEDVALVDDHHEDVGRGGAAAAALWDGERVQGYVAVDNLITQRPITQQQTELLRLLAADLGHLCARKRVEETLHEREKWVSLVMEHSTDGINICRVDPETGCRKLVMCNDQYVEMSGYTRRQLMDADNLDVLTETIQTTPEFLAHMLTGISEKGMDAWIRPDGKENYHEWTAAPLEINGVLHIIGIDRDITERLRNERALKKSEESERAFRKQLQVLHEVILELAKSESVDELCRKTSEFGRNRLGFDRIAVYFRSEEDPDYYVGTYGIDPDTGKVRNQADHSFRITQETKPNQDAIRQRGEWYIDDGEVFDDDGQLLGRKIRTGASLWDSHHAFGVVTVDNTIGYEPISEQQVEIIRLMAAEIGHLIIRKRAEDELHASEESERAFRKQLQVLHEVILELARSKSVDELCRKTVELGHGRLGFDGISIFFPSEDNPRRFTGTLGIDTSGELWDIKHLWFDSEPDSPFDRVLRGQSQEWVIDDTDQGPGEPWGVTGPYMRAGAALWDSQKAFGLLTINNWNQLEPITPQHVELVRLLAAEVGHLIVRQRAEDELHASEESERTFRKQLETLHEIIISLTKAQSVDELCRKVVEYGHNRLGFDGVSVYLPDEENPHTFRGVYGIDKTGKVSEFSNHSWVAADGGETDRVLQGIDQAWCVTENEVHDAEGHVLGTKMRAGAAMWDSQEAFGVLTINNQSRLEPITLQQVELVRLLAAQLGHLIVRTRAEKALQASEESERAFRKKLEILHEVSIELAKADSIPELCRRTVELGRSRLGFDRVGLWLTGDQPNVFTGTFGTDEHGNTVDDWGVQYTAHDDYLSMQVLSKQLPVAIVHRDSSSDPYFETSPASMWAIAPLWDGEKAVGYLSTDNLITDNPITDEQGEVLKLLASTAGYLYTRKLAEQALRENERWLRLVMEHSTDGINVCKIDPETSKRTLVICNEQFVEMSGFSREELFATDNLDAITHTIAKGEMIPGVGGERIQSSGLDAWDRPDGKENYHEWTAAPLEIEGELHIIGVDRDVTERIRSEKDMRIKDSAIDGAVSPISIIDKDRNFSYVNQSFLDLWGYEDASQVIGKSVMDLYTVRMRRDEMDRILDQIGNWSGEVEGIRKDGTKFDAHAAISLVYDKDGAPMCAMASFLDITERRELERQVMEVGIVERQKVGQDLHDSLGQILTGVGFLTRSLQEKLDRKSLPEATDAARIAAGINESIHQARSLARGLQPVRLEAGGLMDALREFADNTSRLFGVSCVFQCKKEVLIADNVTAAHVYHIAQEAVNNAFRHGKAGNIIIDLDIDGDEITLRITDDGRGLPQDITDGKGMGMRTMNYRAAMIGGVLEIQTDRREGTSIICRFRAPEAHR